MYNYIHIFFVNSYSFCIILSLNCTKLEELIVKIGQFIAIVFYLFNFYISDIGGEGSSMSY